MRTLTYRKDDTTQRIKILGISDLDFKVSWTLVSSEPAVLTAVRCTRSSVTGSLPN